MDPGERETEANRQLREANRLLRRQWRVLYYGPQLGLEDPDEELGRVVSATFDLGRAALQGDIAAVLRCFTVVSQGLSAMLRARIKDRDREAARRKGARVKADKQAAELAQRREKIKERVAELVKAGTKRHIINKTIAKEFNLSPRRSREIIKANPPK